MNAIFFGLKRAFHGTLRVARPGLKRIGLTAARFDLLHAILGDAPNGAIMYQSRLRRILGVSRPTVSRMIRSLEELGLMTRERCQRDRRQLLVGLTRRGRSLTRFARRLFIRSGWAQLAVDSALGTDTTRHNRWHDDMHCLMEMAKLDGLLGRVRYAFGDFATLDYPYGPDN